MPGSGRRARAALALQAALRTPGPQIEELSDEERFAEAALPEMPGSAAMPVPETPVPEALAPEVPGSASAGPATVPAAEVQEEEPVEAMPEAAPSVAATAVPAAEVPAQEPAPPAAEVPIEAAAPLVAGPSGEPAVETPGEEAVLPEPAGAAIPPQGLQAVDLLNASLRAGNISATRALLARLALAASIMAETIQELSHQIGEPMSFSINRTTAAQQRRPRSPEGPPA